MNRFNHRNLIGLAGGICLAIAAPLAGAVDLSSTQLEFFEERIRPVLAENCYQCHSQKDKKLKGDLLLDRRSGLLKGGDLGPAIVPGKPDDSRLLHAISYEDVDFQMPPKRKLSGAAIADLRRWIQMGAPWPEEISEGANSDAGKFDIEARRKSHWAWQPIRVVEPGPLKHAAWPAGPIDRYILNALESKGLMPAPAADKRALIRRATFDVIGLPPTAEEIDAFLADTSSRAFENVVDRLLASKHFGERWGRHWLDLVRYAETMGHEFDYPVHNAWLYRDYIIRAFNADVPYNQLVREHVAGDLLEKPRRHPETGINESAIGTAFYWLAQQKHSPVDSRQEQADLVGNQIDVLSKTFLGLTVACARCHDHKFDAISTRDFYSLFGVLSSSRYTHRALDAPEEIDARKHKLGELKREIQDRLLLRLKAGVDQIDDYILAVEEARNAPPILRKEVDSNTEIFEDFEKELYEGWEAEGEAFAKGPVRQELIGDYQGNVGAIGHGFLNSHNVWRDGEIVRKDSFTGSLTSKPFTIARPYIHFLIGGGNRKDVTALQLLIDGEVVGAESGRNSNRMAPGRFDVAQFVGREARLRVIDRYEGGWGNIGLDHIVFSQRPEYFEGDNQVKLPDARLAAVAMKHKLDESLLSRWLFALEKLKTKPARRSNAAAETIDANVFVDFSKDRAKDWFIEGHAFPSGPGDGVDLIVNKGGETRIIGPGWMHSGLLSRRLQGSLRSPTFTIDQPYIHVLAMGAGSRINIVVNGFTLIKNPIYGGLKKDVQDESPHWITVDVKMWRGQSCYLEFVDNSAVDPAGKGYPADGFIAVQRIVFSSSKKVQGKGGVIDPVRRAGESVAEFAAGIQRSAKLALSDGGGSDAESANYLGWLLRNELLSDSEGDAVAAALDHYVEIESGVPVPTLVAGMTEGTPRDEKIFIRGSHRTPGAVAKRSFLDGLKHIQSQPFQQGSGRLELARDIVHPDNPLTSRVIVNRIWHHLTGRGIVPTTDDFGVLGQRPTHPQLLDWLASEFQNDGGSIKKTIRRVMLSRTYQMSSRPDDAEVEREDPNNEWLHRMRVRRLQGEAIRDSVLAISGGLDRKQFGRPVPIHLTDFMEGRGRPKNNGPLDGAGRRSIYIEVRRNFLSPMMLAFDTPQPATTIGRRTISNVPAQGLIMMNDPFVVEQANRWAEKVVAQPNGAGEQRLTRMYVSALGRPPTAEERIEGLAFLAELGGNDSVDAWAALCHVLFTLKEFVFLN